MSKKNVITEEMAQNDMRTFLEEMKASPERIESFLSKMNGQLAEFFKVGGISLNEDKQLVQEFRHGEKLIFTPKRPKIQDLNSIKPPNYDKLDIEMKQLIPVTFLTGRTYRELVSNFYVGDLDFAVMMTSFFKD